MAAMLATCLVTAPARAQDGEVYSPVYVADSLAAQEHVDEANRLLTENRPLDAAAALQPVIETMADKLIQSDKVDVLTGIAYDKEGKRLFVTGKNWPKIFEIRLVRRR